MADCVKECDKKQNGPKPCLSKICFEDFRLVCSLRAEITEAEGLKVLAYKAKWHFCKHFILHPAANYYHVTDSCLICSGGGAALHAWSCHHHSLAWCGRDLLWPSRRKSTTLSSFSWSPLHPAIGGIVTPHVFSLYNKNSLQFCPTRADVYRRPLLVRPCITAWHCLQVSCVT